MPLERVRAPAPEPDPIIEEWRAIVLSDKTAADTGPSMRRFADPQVSDPCQGCGAWCCKVLVFNRGLPGDAAQLAAALVAAGMVRGSLAQSTTWYVSFRTCTPLAHF